jgi:hypothetical protein
LVKLSQLDTVLNIAVTPQEVNSFFQKPAV